MDETLWSKVKAGKKQMYVAKLHCSTSCISSKWCTSNKEQWTLFFPTSNYISPFFPLLPLCPGSITCTLSIRYGNGVCNNSEKEGYETWNFGEETCALISKWRHWDLKLWKRNVGWNLDNLMDDLKNGGLKCIALAKTPNYYGPFVVEVMMKL